MKVSICIPIYKVEKYVRRCLDSIQNQTYKNLEIIIVNDCTPDNSMSVVREYEQQDSRIVVFDHEHNKGLMKARRTAYMNATGDYITFLDSDDYLPKNSIEKLVDAIKLSNADVVSGSIEYVPCDAKRVILPNQLTYGTDRKSVLKSLLKKEFGHNLCSKIFRRELLQCYPYDTYDHFNNGEDGMLFYQVLKNSSKTVQIPDVVYYYCQNLQSSSQVRLSESGLRSILLLNKVRKQMCILYPSLYKLLFNYISPTIISLYFGKYVDKHLFKKYISENGLEDFIKLNNMIHYLSLKNSILLLALFFKSILKEIISK